MSERPFIDFYNRTSNIPVRQDLARSEHLVEARKFLYRTIGVPFETLRGKRIIEFGPGGGFNACALGTIELERYDFVDASTESLSILRGHIEEGRVRAENIDVYDSDMHDFANAKVYDLVIAEGLIPGQIDPGGTLEHLLKFVTPGGVIVLTVMSVWSLLPELLRRVYGKQVLRGSYSEAHATSLLEAEFARHLDNLPGVKRPIADWVQDVIVHDWTAGNYAFGIEDCLNVTLTNGLQLRGCSPNILVDTRWYKEPVDDKSYYLGDRGKDALKLFNLLSMDRTLTLGDVMKTRIDEPAMDIIGELVARISLQHDDLWKSETTEASSIRLLDTIRELEANIPKEIDGAKRGLAEIIENFEGFIQGEIIEFKEFSAWWGRGQQYVAFQRS